MVELGVVPSRNLKDPSSSLGPTIAVEVEPIEKWLELEAGVTPSFGRHSTEWATDLVFKKPWTLSPKVEFMASIGPEWIHKGIRDDRKLGRRRSCAGFHVLAQAEA
jgi:hypothetical protein